MEAVRLFDRDPDLLAGTPSSEAERLRGYESRALRVPPGRWHAAYDEQERGTYALVLLEGTLSRRLVLEERRSVELLAPGDVLRPWVEDSESLLPTKVEWYAHEGVTIAVLAEQFPRQVAAYPRIMHVLADRMILRSRWLQVQVAIGHRVGLNQRILLILWHLADRWGRVTPKGIEVNLRLTHEVLADLVGARRPSVSTALGELDAAGVVQRLPDGQWVLANPTSGSLTDWRSSN